MRSEGGSPALGIPCPKCLVEAGSYCRKENGAKQIIAHKVRRDAQWKAAPSTSLTYWAITVNGWGTLYGRGSEAHAEEWRRHKATWEAAVAKKRPATALEIARETFDDLAGLLGYASTPPSGAEGE